MNIKYTIFSKHRVAKNIVESAKNFRNISLTVAERQQMRMASIYYSGMFETYDYIIKGEANQVRNITEEGDFWEKVKSFVSGYDTVCSEIFVWGQNFKKGDVVVIEVLNGGDCLKVGVIKMFLIKEGRVYLAVREYLSRRAELGFYVTMHVAAETKFISKLADTKPLIMRGTQEKFQFVLHHYISFDYS